MFSCSACLVSNRIDSQSQAVNSTAVISHPSMSVSDMVIEKMAHTFDRTRGSDWERFAEGLGNTLQERNEIRIQPGEVDVIERLHHDTRTRLREVLKMFGTRCIQVNVSKSLVQIIVETLRDEQVFGKFTYNRLARQIESL